MAALGELPQEAIIPIPFSERMSPTERDSLRESMLSYWTAFGRIAAIPRDIYDEGAIVADTLKFAGEIEEPAGGMEIIRDNMGNILVEIGATPGFEGKDGILQQAHQDMICLPKSGEPGSPAQKGVKLEFVKLREKGEDREEWWVRAEDGNTTLGGDDANGLALMRTFMAESNKFQHGRLGFLFTVSEEEGLIGAVGLGDEIKKKLPGYRYMLNLDTDHKDTITIASAGAARTTIGVPITWEKADNKVFRTLSLSGLAGGHSGGDIHLGRGNSIKVMGQVLAKLKSENIPFHLVAIDGGDKMNIIPKACITTIAFAPDWSERIDQIIDEEAQTITTTPFTDAPDRRLETDQPQEIPAQIMDRKTTDTTVDLIAEMPQGVINWLEENVLPRTSTNLGVVRTENDQIVIQTMSRSSDLGQLKMIRVQIAQLAARFGAPYVQPAPYSGFEGNPEGELVRKIQEASETLFGKAMELRRTHGGIETGVLTGYVPIEAAMEAASIGGWTIDYHALGERTNMPATTRLYMLVKQLITG